jgi:hypothetical protein
MVLPDIPNNTPSDSLESIWQESQPDLLDAPLDAPIDAFSPEPEPEPEATPEPEPTPAPDEMATLRAENARLTREAEARARENQEMEIQSTALEFAQQRINHYIQQNYDEQVARQLAISETREQVNAFRAEQAVLRATRIELSQQFGVPQEQLLNFRDEAAMRHYAEQYANTMGPNANELAALRAEVAALKKGMVPAQSYNNPGNSGPSGSDQEINNRYGRGELQWSPQVAQARKRLGYD